MTDARTRSTEEDVFVRLSENPDFALYLSLLAETIQKVTKGLRKPLGNDKEVADHNYIVGVLAGLTTATEFVRARLATLNSAVK